MGRSSERDTYRMVDRNVLVRTSGAGALAELAELAGHRGEVLFEVDYHAPLERRGWSVLLRGTATIVPETNPEAMCPVSKELTRLVA